MKAQRISLVISLIISLVLLGWWITSNLAILLAIFLAPHDYTSTTRGMTTFPVSDTATYNTQGRALLDLRKYNESIRYFDKALAINPDSFYALDNKGAALLLLGKYNQSIGYFDKALTINPNFIYPLVGKGIALFKLGKYDQSIPYFDKALAINPKDINALNYKKFARAALNKK